MTASRPRTKPGESLPAHEHVWTALWDHFGRYGDQESHFHQCFECEAMLVGPGRVCAKGCKHEVRDA